MGKGKLPYIVKEVPLQYHLSIKKIYYSRTGVDTPEFPIRKTCITRIFPHQKM